MMYLQTKFGRIWISGYWDIEQREIQFVRMRNKSILRYLGRHVWTEYMWTQSPVWYYTF